MMILNYIKINSFYNITKFDFTNNNDIGLIKNNEPFIFNSTFDEIIIDLPKKSTSMFFFESDLYVTDSEMLITKIFSNNLRKQINLKSLISIPTTLDKRTFEKYIFPIIYEKNINKRYNGKFNTKNHKVENYYDINIGLNGIYQVLNNDLFLSQNNEKFGVFNFNNNCIWECNYKDLFDKYEPIGAGTTNILKVDNKLYVELDKTYRIDMETGKIEQVYDYKFTKSENELLYGLQFLSMTEFQLAILNTITNKVKIIDVSDAFNKLNVYPDNRIVVSNGLVYFSQNMGDNIAKIGVLSPNSGKILWKHDFDKKNGMIGTLKVNGDIIYAHTQDRTLHIFEKKQNETI